MPYFQHGREKAMPKSKTVKESFGFTGKICISKGGDKTCLALKISPHLGLKNILLIPKRARELFEAGLQMCDELEGK